MDIVTKTYSLEPDMLSGWKPKMRIVGPVPLNFDNPVVDTVIQQLTSYGKKYAERVVYLGTRIGHLGNRPASSYKMHQQLKHDYEFRYAYLYTANYSHLAAFFRKFYSGFQSKRTRLFKGMNPTLNLNQQLIFDSNFEGGNLDAAIKVGPHEYDLFMRIDSNTRGHIQWYNFTIKNQGLRKIKLNICNFRKEKTLYHRGMKPYVFSKQLKESKGIGWHQAGLNVKFDKQSLRYTLLDDYNYSSESTSFNCLQFEYQFERDNDEVSFAYCPPYSYSNMLDSIRHLLQKDHKQCILFAYLEYIKQNILCQSLSGLHIPLLTITDSSVPDTHKKCIIVSGRIHPGESNGSHMMHGFLEFVCGDTVEAQELRKMLVIKAVPMLNPDGVVLGNFRTSLCGRDLNRAFKSSVDMLFPEVRHLKQLAIQTKDEFKNRLIMFLDFHGHSVKKNVFFYGAQYALGESNYYKTRILPKLISTKTEMFRYYSCMFRIATFKRATARAVLLKNIPHCYTVEASNGSYYSPEDKKDIDFTPEIFQSMGKIIADSLKEYLDLLLAEEAMQAEKRKKIKEYKLMKKRRSRADDTSRFMSTEKYSRNDVLLKDRKLRLSSVNSVEQPHQVRKDAQHRSSFVGNQLEQLPLRTRQLIGDIIKDEQMKVKDEGHDSDKFSEGGSDSQSHDDLEEQEMQKLHNGMMDVLEEFKARFYNKKISEVRSRRQISDDRSRREKRERERQRKPIEVIPSLRKQVEEAEVQHRKLATSHLEVFNWPRIREDFVIRASNLRVNSKNFVKSHLEQNSVTSSGSVSYNQSLFVNK